MGFYEEFIRGIKDPVSYYRLNTNFSMQLYRVAMKTKQKDTIITRASSNLEFAVEDLIKLIYLKHCT